MTSSKTPVTIPPKSMLDGLIDYTAPGNKWAPQWNIVDTQYNRLGEFMRPSIDVVRRVFNVCAHLTRAYDPTHDLGHHTQVFKNGMEICQRLMLKNRMRVITFVIYSTLTHDIIDKKYPENLAEKDAALTQFFFNDLGCDAVNAKWIVSHMSFGKENEAKRKEGKLHGTNERTAWISHDDPDVQLARDISSDADKLEALGEIGIERTYGVGRMFNEKKIAGMKKEEANAFIENVVIEHAHEKLLLLKDDYIYTSAGKELAEAGHKHIADHVKMLEEKKRQSLVNRL